MARVWFLGGGCASTNSEPCFNIGACRWGMGLTSESVGGAWD